MYGPTTPHSRRKKKKLKLSGHIFWAWSKICCRQLFANQLKPIDTMNISDPVQGQVAAVDFEHMTTEFIRSISVKHIQSVDTYDSSLAPFPSGLYDASLGSQENSM